MKLSAVCASRPIYPVVPGPRRVYSSLLYNQPELGGWKGYAGSRGLISLVLTFVIPISQRMISTRRFHGGVNRVEPFA